MRTYNSKNSIEIVKRLFGWIGFRSYITLFHLSREIFPPHPLPRDFHKCVFLRKTKKHVFFST